MLQDIQRGRELVAAAVTWLDEGVSVVPAQPRSKAVRLRWRQFESEPAGIKLIRQWFSSGVMNLAVICGTGGLLVLDFDDLARYQEWKEKAHYLARSYTETSGKGIHVFYFVDDPKTRRFAQCEALGTGHLCNVAPSIHPTGKLYKPVGDPCTPILHIETKKLFSLLSDPVPVVNPGQGRAALSKDKLPAAGSDLIARIKAALPLVDYVSTLTELKPSGGAGRWLTGLCPLHDDTSPSLWIDTKKQTWRCFSPACRGAAGGDVLNFYALVNGLTVLDAIKELARSL